MHSLNKLKVIGLLLVIVLVVSAYVTQERQPVSTAVKIGFIGDSITSASYLKTTPVEAEIAALGDNFSGVNRGVGGSTTRDWRPEGQTYAGALATFRAGNAHVVSIMLGTNDARDDVAATPEEYGKNLRRLVSALLATGTIHFVILNYPPYTAPGADGAWGAHAAARLEGYTRQIDMLALKPGVLLGDTKAHEYFKQHQDKLKDGVHPTQEGAVQLGRLWAQGYRRALRSETQQKQLVALGFTKKNETSRVGSGSSVYR